MKIKRSKVIVAMSGGVDSSVAAALLKKQGFDVVGIFMKFWKQGRSSDNRCCSVESEKLARLTAKKLNIPFYVLNVEKEFKSKVVDEFLKEYKKGNTPNPCVVCNKEIKFGFLIKKALSLGADFVATGHYARQKNSKSSSARSVNLFEAKDKDKDQSYFLWQLDQEQLKHIMFPVGKYTKPEVRELAKKFKLPTVKTPESQEVCFVQDTVNNFLSKYLSVKPGNVVDVSGKILGKHNGLWFYTIGQRHGLNIPQGPYYVVNKNIKKNYLVVSKSQKDLEKEYFVANKVNWIVPQKLPINANIKIRYKSNFAKAKIIKEKKNSVKIIFNKPQKAITPGQSAVFYKGNQLLGGGIIC
jgi:tRNA-specific 2-thiouridylase